MHSATSEEKRTWVHASLSCQHCNINLIWHLIHRCCTAGCCTHAVKGTHLLAVRVSTEPAEGLHVGTWPPSLSPSCSQMSFSSSKLQVLSPASLSGLNKALRKKEGKWVRAGKKKGDRMQDRTLCNWLRDAQRKIDKERVGEKTLDHLIKQTGLF